MDKNTKEYGNWKRYEYPKDMITVAQDRTRNLLHISILGSEPIRKLLESAYLQGLIDGVEARELCEK